MMSTWLLLSIVAVSAPAKHGAGPTLTIDTESDSGRVAISAAAPETAFTTVIVVRHAEKSTTQLGHDVPLSEAGLKRAQALARVLADAGVTRIYATPTRRAMHTGEPLAKQLGDSVRVVDDTGELLRRLGAHAPGDVVLVIGHSDTVPAIVKGLSGASVADFKPGEFDRMYVVTLTRSGAASVVRLRYGDPS